jgi:hypothetical protein
VGDDDFTPPALPASPFDRKPLTFNQALLAVAVTELGTRESSRNSGPRVDEYLASVGLDGGYPWCAAFVHFCAGKARPAGFINPCPRTAGALRMWELSHPECRTKTPAPGCIFVLDTGATGGAGHVGIVEEVCGDGTIITIEGNTNSEGSREGDCVGRHKWNPAEGKRGVLRGYIDLGCKIGGERTA